MDEVLTPRTLLLLRHATAGLGGIDIERPLSTAGRAEAEAVGRTVAPMAVDLVLSSTSCRTRETVAGLDLSCPALFASELYLASAETMLTRIRATDASVGVLLVAAHNPGVASLAQALVAAEADRRRLDGPFPPASLAVLTVAGPWKRLRPSSAHLVALHRPG